MDCSLEVRCQNMPHLKSIRRHFEKEVAQLDQKYGGIESCQVVFGLPSHHRYPGNIYEFQIEIVTPGKILKVARHPSVDGAGSNVFKIIREAFHEIDDQLLIISLMKNRELIKSERRISNKVEATHDNEIKGVYQKAARTIEEAKPNELR